MNRRSASLHESHLHPAAIFTAVTAGGELLIMFFFSAKFEMNCKTFALFPQSKTGLAGFNKVFWMGEMCFLSP